MAAALSFFLARSIVAADPAGGGGEPRTRRGRDAGAAPEEGAAELASLAQAFNEMAEQLAASRESERNFLLSVSHELKTPLTAIRGYAEGLGEGAFTAGRGRRGRSSSRRAGSSGSFATCSTWRG